MFRNLRLDFSTFAFFSAKYWLILFLLPILVACGGGGSGGGDGGKGSVPILAFNNGQMASVVIGQPDFLSASRNQGNGSIAAANTFDAPLGNPAFSSDGKLLIADTDNSRLLVFNQIPSSNNAAADLAIGQTDLMSNTSGTSASVFSFPITPFVTADNKLFVVDVFNQRVLMWDQLPTNFGVAADLVIGQIDFNSATQACNASSLNNPYDVFVVNGKLLIADKNNNRILIWNTLPASNGAAADIVLGQQTMDTCQSNDSDGDGSDDGVPAANTLNGPFGVWSDGQRLLVSDSGNYRVLIWDSFPTVNGQEADLVLGQANMQTNSVPTLPVSAIDDYVPTFIAVNGNQLFVAMGRGSVTAGRVLIWDEMPTTSQQTPDRVIGQISFDANNITDVSGQVINSATGVRVSGAQLFVADANQHRVLVFDAP